MDLKSLWGTFEKSESCSILVIPLEVKLNPKDNVFYDPLRLLCILSR